MQVRKVQFFGVGLLLALAGVSAWWLLASDSISAQRAAAGRFEYAVINGSYRPYPYGDSPSTIAGAVNICYLQSTGCQNEEVKAEIIISKFVQDERLENTNNITGRAFSRAVQNAFSKTIAKLGSDGWEMIDQPQIEFDLYYESGQANKSVIEAQRTERQHVWFKRVRQ